MLGCDRITFDGNIMIGQACIRGMRITVSLVLNLLAPKKFSSRLAPKISATITAKRSHVR